MYTPVIPRLHYEDENTSNLREIILTLQLVTHLFIKCAVDRGCRSLCLCRQLHSRGQWCLFMRTLEHTIRCFNAAFSACAVIDGCQCGKSRKASRFSGSKWKLWCSYIANLLAVKSIASVGSVAWPRVVASSSCAVMARADKALGTESWGLAEPRAQQALSSSRDALSTARLLLPASVPYLTAYSLSPQLSLHCCAWCFFPLCSITWNHNIFCQDSTIIFM